MAEYIERKSVYHEIEELKERVIEGSKTDTPEEKEALLLKLYGFNYALAVVSMYPEEDVQPVRHGRWITVVETDGKEHSKCADCQMELDGLEDAYSFCPHCGAKMDE